MGWTKTTTGWALGALGALGAPVLGCQGGEVIQERVTTDGTTTAADDPDGSTSVSTTFGSTTTTTTTTTTTGDPDDTTGAPDETDDTGDSDGSTGPSGPTLACADHLLDGALPIIHMGTLSEDDGDDFFAGAACTEGSGGYDQAFEFVAPQGGSYVIDTLDSEVDTVLMVYDSCGGALLQCNDDQDLDNEIFQSEVVMGMVPGQRVLIVVDGWGDFAVGDFALQIRLE
jgi:hypothetical protein